MVWAFTFANVLSHAAEQAKNLALAGFELGIAFANHVNLATTAHHFTVFVASFCRLERT
jgi:hypothetical protein